MTPSIARLGVHTRGGRDFRLWLPLFLLWIPFLLLLPLIVLVLMVAALAARKNLLRIVNTLWAVLCSLPGTEVRVASEGNNFALSIF